METNRTSPTLDTILPRLSAAIRGGNRAAAATLYPALASALREVDPVLRRVTRGQADLDDLRQETLLKIHRFLEKHSSFEAENPSAWASTVARSVAIDWCRARARQRARAAEPQFVARLEESGVHALRFPEIDAALREDHDLAERVRGHVRAYAATADRAPRAARGHQVLVWHWLRVQHLPIPTIQCELGRLDLTAPQIWKWAERGAQLVAELAERDPDRERAALMCRMLAALRAA